MGNLTRIDGGRRLVLRAVARLAPDESATDADAVGAAIDRALVELEPQIPDGYHIERLSVRRDAWNFDSGRPRGWPRPRYHVEVTVARDPKG